MCLWATRRRRPKGNIALCATAYNNRVINGSGDTRTKFFVVQQIFDPAPTSQSVPLILLAYNSDLTPKRKTLKRMCYEAVMVYLSNVSQP